MCELPQTLCPNGQLRSLRGRYEQTSEDIENLKKRNALLKEALEEASRQGFEISGIAHGLDDISVMDARPAEMVSSATSTERCTQGLVERESSTEESTHCHLIIGDEPGSSSFFGNAGAHYHLPLIRKLLDEARKSTESLHNESSQRSEIEIIGRWGYSTVKTNLLTVPPYSVAVIVMWVFVISSDRHRERTLHVMGSNALVLIGCIVLGSISIKKIGVGYFCTFLIASGSFIPTVLFQRQVFVQNNTTKENHRAFRAAICTFGANAGGIVSANIFLSQFAPQYVTPLIVSAAMAGLGIVVLGILRTYMVLDNRRRNREQGVNWTSKDVPTAALKDGPAGPSWRHFY
nr:uncharacterized protein I203_04241 [Kwoniella mangroviensis CBS 8507]OCF66665.1 hypothetical protein I203_04241 [Kwoniella mangroviensis CBS 8507]